MSVILNTPSFNDRLAIVFGKTKTLDKTLKLASNLSDFSADLSRYLAVSNNASVGFEALGECFSSMRNGIKIFDALGDLKQPSGDSLEIKMKWVELISFTVADVLNPVLYFEAQGFYNINKQVKEQLVKYGSQLGLIGLATNVVRTVYEFYKSFSQMKKIDMAFHSRDIDEQRRSLVDTKRVANQHMQAMQQHLASFDQTVEQLKRGQLGVKAINRYRSVHNRIMGSLGSDTIPNGFSGREDLKDEELTEAKDILNRYQKDTATIIDELRLKIDTCNQKIEELNNLEVGREVSAQYFNQRLFSLIESVLELSSAILMLSSVCIASIPAATIAASLGVLSSSVALIRIWQKSGLSSEDEAQYQEVINWTAQVLMRMQQNQLEEGSGGSNPSASNLTLRREQ